MVRLVPVPGEDPVVDALSRQATARVDADGSFVITDVAPGRYRLVAVSEGGWVMRSAEVGGQDSLDFPFEVTAGHDIGEAIVSLIDRRTELSGTVVGPTGRPAPETTLLLYPSDRRYWRSPRRILVVRPTTSGRFKLSDLPPGEYLVAAVGDLEPAAVLDAAYLERLTPIDSFRVVEGESRTREVRVGAPAR
jgi:hypothetical protein